MKEVLFCAIDVDDNLFHAHLISEKSGKVFRFSCRPNVGALTKKLNKFQSEFELKVCYEATYLGNSLCRQILNKGITCEVIATSLIPEVAGRQVKTDRLDCEKLCVYFMKGLLTAIHIPTQEEEIDRDFIRSRNFVMDQLRSVRSHVLSICRRVGWDFKQETKHKSHWTQVHLIWLEDKLKKEENKRLKSNLSSLLLQLEQIKKALEFYNEEIESLASDPKYQQRANALLCYRGFDYLTAMTMITEIGDIKRFSHPRKLVSYIGLDIKEYSSGGKERRFGITRLGSRYIRTPLVESCQTALGHPNVGPLLARRRKGITPELVAISDRCMRRLHKKGSRLLYAGKNINKVKVACAREMVGFIWESLKAVA